MAEHGAADNVHTRGIAAFVSALGYEAIPAEVRERIKLLMLDSLGCALYGADLEWSRILQTTLAAVDTTRTTAVWGTAGSLSAPHAALVNGTQVQGFELDDVHRQGVLHVGAVALPALIAVAESHGRNERPGFPGRRGRRLRDRPARRHVHGRRSTSARAGTRARRSASSRPPPAPRAACGCRPSRPCMRSASPARSRPG